MEIIKAIDILSDPESDMIYATKEIDDSHIMGMEALGKQIPKKALNQRIKNEELIGSCPTCKLLWDVGNWERYCSNCGQKLDWSK
ncbi:MAG TPA: hypothetical protein GXZ90_00375 [Clostridiales bacterium]|nr:hypothetical protein [Clostridiales bacterium]